MKRVIIIIGILSMTSCGVNRVLTEKQKKENNINYELNKLYLEYSYKRDSLLIELYKE